MYVLAQPSPWLGKSLERRTKLSTRQQKCWVIALVVGGRATSYALIQLMSILKEAAFHVRLTKARLGQLDTDTSKGTVRGCCQLKYIQT